VIVLLDESPLSRISNPGGAPINGQCQAWLAGLLTSSTTRVLVPELVPEIAEYEVRRELLRARKASGLARLDRVVGAFGSVSATRPVMLRAAELWAIARQQGYQMAQDAALDADVILAAQAIVLSAGAAERVVIATENAQHLARFTEAIDWRSWSSLQP
jgi:hypothetical protein